MNDKTEWVMVPRAPTPEMELAGKHTMKGAADMLFERFIAIAVYQSMLAAAPPPPVQDALMCDVLNMRAVMQRMVAGIKHLAEIARQWEPDHSSGADRRGWLLALEAADDAKALLDALRMARAQDQGRKLP